MQLSIAKIFRSGLKAFCIVIFFLNGVLYTTHHSSKSAPYLVLHDAKWGYGFFIDFLGVVGALRLYETRRISGVSINFGTDGVYYDPSVGENWWEYYFEPIHLGERVDSLVVPCHHAIQIGSDAINLTCVAEFQTYREEAYHLIEKYIRVKPYIEGKVQQIVNDSFGYSTIIGVHYRGTDKWTEAPMTPFENVAAYIDDAIAQLVEIGHFEIKIFVATDEQNFLDYMRERYPSRVICYEESERSGSGTAVHLSGSGGTPYKKGEDAIIDCLLLSKTDIILKTSSCLSLCSSYFNPYIPVIHMTWRSGCLPLE
jgi:hypothetical protein